jgi:Xaa-Pro aminopeptidase
VPASRSCSTSAGRSGGYGSDITRTLWVTGGDDASGPDETYRHLFAVLRSAQERATQAVRPGVSCESIDAAARDVITAEGYGDAFIHRTGHGIGLEGHEEPYLVAGNAEALGEGTAFSVEPGIYLEGRYGARIEDIVVCGPHGPIPLNTTSRELPRRRRLRPPGGPGEPETVQAGVSSPEEVGRTGHESNRTEMTSTFTRWSPTARPSRDVTPARRGR